MDKKQTILIVDDNDINRNILANLLQEEYEIIQAENGNNALDKVSNKISAILLNLAMPTMDSYDFLKAFKKTPYYGIPAIVITEDNTKENEKNAFNLGAWDFIPKPYDVEILKCRLQCSILKSESETFKKLKHLSEHDGLTGIYNRSKFFIETKEMLKAY
ncbi:MAG: response regulator, partial [Oscillospiraceae bacterium]